MAFHSIKINKQGLASAFIILIFQMVYLTHLNQRDIFGMLIVLLISMMTCLNLKMRQKAKVERESLYQFRHPKHSCHPERSEGPGANKKILRRLKNSPLRMTTTIATISIQPIHFYKLKKIGHIYKKHLLAEMLF